MKRQIHIRIAQGSAMWIIDMNINAAFLVGQDFRLWTSGCSVGICGLILKLLTLKIQPNINQS